MDSPRILVVDDEPFLRKLYCRTLEAEGWPLLEASDGASAWALLQGGSNIGLVVTDVLMPGITGADLAARILSLPHGPPVLLVSAYTADELVRYDIRVPITPLLLKPFRPAELIKAVRALLGPPGASSDRAGA